MEIQNRPISVESIVEFVQENLYFEAAKRGKIPEQKSEPYLVLVDADGNLTLLAYVVALFTVIMLLVSVVGTAEAPKRRTD